MKFRKNKKFSREDIVNYHKLVVKEMEKRGINHNIHDELDRLTEDLLKSIEDVVVVPEFVSIVGSTVHGDSHSNDLDILIRAERTEKGFLIQAENIELPLRNLVATLPTRNENYIIRTGSRALCKFTLMIVSFVIKK